MSEQTSNETEALNSAPNAVGSMISWWARNSVAANLMMVAAFFAGFASFLVLEREMIPTVQFNGAHIGVSWNGASARDMEEQIVIRIEEAVADIDGLKRLNSRSQEGYASINLEAKKTVDPEVFINEVKLRVDSVNNLPPDSFRPYVSTVRMQNDYFGMAVYGDIDRKELKRIGEDLRDELARIPGSELAQIQGVLDEEISIEVSENDLRRYGLSFDEVTRAIRSTSLNGTGGSVQTDTGDVTLATRNLADNADQFGDIILRQLPDGATLKIGDVAEVKDGLVDFYLNTRYNDQPAAFIFVSAPDNMNVPEYTKNIREFIEDANKKLPDSVRVDMLWDDSEMYNELLRIISSSALLGLFLVLTILILFLRPAVAFWVTIGIATAFAGGFALLSVFGVTLNILTLFAFLLVIGIVVDDAIIIGESIHAEIESGRSTGVTGAIAGAQFVAKPVIFGVLTTMIFFTPYAIMQNEFRSMTVHLSLTVIAALTFSLIEALLILPAHLKHLKHYPKGKEPGPLLRLQGRIADSLTWFSFNVYKPVLEFAIRMRYATLALFIAVYMVAVSIVNFGYIKTIFAPEVEGGLIFGQIELPEGTPKSRIGEVQHQLQTAIDKTRDHFREAYAHEELEGDIVARASVIGMERGIRTFIGLMEPELRPKELSNREIATVLRQNLGIVPDAEEVELNYTFNNFDAAIRFNLSHKDRDVLRRASQEVQAQFRTYAGTFDIGDTLTTPQDELRFTLKDGANALGVTLADVSNQVRQAFYGQEVQRLPRDGDDVRVMVRMDEASRKSLDSLETLRIRTADGREVPLSAVAEYEYAPGMSFLQRRERLPSVRIFAEVVPGVAADIRKDMNENFWPGFKERYPDILQGVGAQTQDEDDAAQEIFILGLLSLFAMYVMLAIAFNSYWQPVLIMTAIPFAYAGAVFGHAFMGQAFTLFSWFGIFAAAGIVVNDNLVLVDFINKRRAQGAGALQAIVDAGVIRFRPILLTSVTTFVGVLPMMTERSAQAQFLMPMVVSLAYAVIFAVFLSLLLVPSLYAIGVELRRIWLRGWAGIPYASIGNTYAGQVDTRPANQPHSQNDSPAQSDTDIDIGKNKLAY